MGLVILQSAAVTLIFALGENWSTVDLIFNVGIYLGFHVFTLFTSHTALKEAKARAELARVNNAELRATQALLVEGSSNGGSKLLLAQRELFRKLFLAHSVYP